uniref:C2H2-type domain-containing protein n=1 Tax=Denticeps clupeoides TaxID=299321 RepID=A0AAY3ZVR7_9TELE
MFIFAEDGNQTFERHLERHLTQVQTNSVEAVEEKSSLCGLCSKIVDLRELKSHQKMHTKEKPVNGEQCEIGFLQASNFVKQEITEPEEKPYHCEECGVSFSEESLCIECGFNFSCKSHLRRHKLIHTGEKPYQCVQCGMSFSYLSSFRNHLVVHTGEKPYRCEQCGKSFSLRAPNRGERCGTNFSSVNIRPSLSLEWNKMCDATS